MPNFVSEFGVWKAATERVVDPDAPVGKEIYEGPDRAAMQMLKENGDTIGQHFKTNMDFVMRVKQLGFASIDDYLKFIGHDEKKQQAKFDELLKRVNKHELPERHSAVRIDVSGGDDTSGHGNHMKGDLNAPPINVPRMK